MIETKAQFEDIDTEWLELILEAKNMGIEKEEIREFLINNEVKEMILKAL